MILPMGKYFRKSEAAVFHSAKPQLRYTEIYKEKIFLQEKLTKRLMENNVNFPVVFAE